MLEAILGAIIGGILTIAGGFFGELYKYRLDYKRYKRERMQEAYELAERCLIKAGPCGQYVTGEEFRTTIEDTQIKFTLFASKKAESLFDRLSTLTAKPQMTKEEKEEYDKLHEQFVECIRSDLKVH